MEPLFEIGLQRPAKGSRVSAQTLYEQLKAAIVGGRLKAGARLPATRGAGRFFGVSRHTASEVYERLLNDGFVVARHGSGTYVAERASVAKPPRKWTPRKTSAPDHRLNEFWLRADTTAAIGFWHGSRDKTPAVDSGRARHVDFRPALVDSRLFPFDVFRRVLTAKLRGLEQKPASLRSAQGNQGNYSLREAITKHIAATRAVACEPEHVLVTAGAQQAFDLLARVLVTRERSVVAVEDPGYPPLRVAFAAAGAKIVPVEVDAEGLVVDRLPRNARIICVTPSHQFPLGTSMSPARRRQLLDFARQHDAVIIEDDYDGEFRYDGSPLEALRTSDVADSVFYIGTFSKCMLPALRLGYVIAPEWSLSTLVAAKNCLDWHCPLPMQMGVAGFISHGHLGRHVRKMRKLYQQRRDLLLTALRNDFAAWLEPIPSFYGMHVAATVRAAIDLDAVADALSRHDIKIHTLDRYYLGERTRNGLIFGYGAAGPAEIRSGLSALSRALPRRGI